MTPLTPAFSNASTTGNSIKPGPPAVSIQGVGVTYGDPGRRTVALRAVNLAVNAGEFVSIIGPSGCGKTTLLRLVASLIEPTEGRLQVFGGSPDSQRKAGNIGFVFQRPVLLPWRRLRQNVALPLDFQRGLAKRARQPEDALRAVGLLEFADNWPHELSGGMQQRAAIARALIHAPELLLLDEPFGALDEMGRLQMDELVLRLHDESRFTGLLVTHNIQEAIYLADRVVVMAARPGTVVADLGIDLPRPRSAVLLDDPRFLQYARCLREHLFSPV